MLGLIKTLLEMSGFTAAEVQQLEDILSKHFATLALTTLIIVGFGLLLTGTVQHLFYLRGKSVESRRAREEKITDTTIAIYHEIAQDLKSTVISFEVNTLSLFVEKIKYSHKFFPVWTFSANQMFIFENSVKEDIATLPAALIGITVNFYQSALYVLAYMQDTRSDDVKAMNSERKIGFLKRMYDTAFEHANISCDALRQYERWLDDNGIKDFADLAWVNSLPNFTTDDKDLGHITSRMKAYNKLTERISADRKLIARNIAAPAASAATGP